MNIKNTLDQEDYSHWLKETFWFSVPAIIAFLSALAGGLDIKIALGLAFGAMANALQNLYGKYKSGLDEKDFPVGTQTVIDSKEDELVKTQKIKDDDFSLTDPRIETEILPKD